jgi:hypothetical protein
MIYKVIASRNGVIQDELETSDRKYALSYYRFLKRNYPYVEIVKILKNGSVKISKQG